MSRAGRVNTSIIAVYLTIVTMLGGGIYKFSALSSEVAAQTETSKKFEAHLSDTDMHLSKRDIEQIGSLSGKIDKLQEKLDLLVGEMRASREAQGRIEANVSQRAKPVKVSAVVNKPQPKHSKDVVGLVKKGIDKIKGH